MSARPDFRKDGYLEPGCVMPPSLMNAMPSGVPSWALGRDSLGRVALFLAESYWGIKAVRVQSEWDSDDQRSRYRFKFGSGPTA
jgi:hypothetical protein